MKKYRVYVHKYVDKDSFENGCTGEGQDSGQILDFKSASLDQIKKEIESLGIEMKDCEEYEERLETSRMENDAGETPTDLEMTLWKSGKIDLWCASFSIYLDEITETPVNASILAECIGGSKKSDVMDAIGILFNGTKS